MSGFRTIGVLGGMGPAATVDFLDKLLKASGARRDQDHPRVLIDCNPTLPDRHAAIRGAGPSPAPRLAAMAQGLVRGGAEVLCMPCNTAHAFEPEIRVAAAVPFVSIVEATVVEALGRAPGGRFMVLAAEGALEADLYGRAFAARGAESLPIGPDARERLMSLVWRIKSGDTGAEVRKGMLDLARAAVEQGAQAVVAGCTEVPLVLSEGDLSVPVIDSTAALADAVLRAARS